MWGQKLSSVMIWHGYSHGIFPMGSDDSREIHWYEPYERAVFPLDSIYIPKSLRKDLTKPEWRVSFDEAFEDVMRGCRRAPGDNWITDEIIRCFVAVHEEGWAHSCEVWEGDVLIGGLYGLALGTCFCAESMFHRHANASKVALVRMQQKCAELGFEMFDAQLMNPHLERMGAVPMAQTDYRRRLDAALERSTPWTGRRLRPDRPTS
jgi:leucyl/phenylalanyl-tRNA--protein transferase